MVSNEELSEGRVYPPLSKIREVSTQLAVGLTEYAYNNNQALKYPKPEDIDKAIRAYQYSTDYENFIPQLYDWPSSL